MTQRFVPPKNGTLERILLEALLNSDGTGVTYLDFVGSGITEENIETIAENLRSGRYEHDQTH